MERRVGTLMIDVKRFPRSGTLMGRIIRAPLRLIPKSTVIPIIQGPLRGKRWIVGSGINRLWLGSYETEKMLLAARLLQRGDTVFDIGANVGIYTLLFSECVGETGHVVAFEPVPANIHFLRQHVSLNRFCNVSVVEAAVSSTSGVAAFALGESSSVGHVCAAGDLQVRAVKLDDFLAASGRAPSLIKIDVEGGEHDVLKGACHLLAHVRPHLLLAVHSESLRVACTDFLRTYRYRCECVRDAGATELNELIAIPEG
jgi:FkbM family methyltransferase